MGLEARPLHVLFFPLMAPGHMNPMVDMAKLFTTHGVKATILTTPGSARLIQSTIHRFNNTHHHHPPITLTLTPFPSTTLPEGCKNLSSIPLHLQPTFFETISALRPPFHDLLAALLPDCLVSDTYLPWTQLAADALNIPRLAFHGTSFFALCAAHALGANPPLSNTVLLPDLPHRISMLRTQIPDLTKSDPTFVDLFAQIKTHEPNSYGAVVNSFYELEPDYVRHYRDAVGVRAWHIGPVSLSSNDKDDMSSRGGEAATNVVAGCLEWLDSQRCSSTVYACFGSLSEIPRPQLREIALGLEASGRPFIWAVPSGARDWLPDGYEERVRGRGLLIGGWVPQMVILDHAAVGGFVTHCGWNSSLEGVSAGVPMVTWPLFADQFYNERLIVDVLQIGVAVGVEEYMKLPEGRPVVAATKVAAAVERVMGCGEEAEGRRRRARELGETAKRAVEEGGSSCIELESLVSELLLRRSRG